MKKLISILLCAVLLFGCAMPAFAADNDYDGAPVVVVRGFDFMALQHEDGSPALTFSFGQIFPGVVKLLFNMLLCNEAGMVDTLVETVDALFGPISSDNDGNFLEDVSMQQYHSSLAAYPDFFETRDYVNEEGILATASEKIGAENCYFFTYDWRLTPQELAAQLNTLIETAKAETGKEQVRLVSASMGTVVTSAYLYYYGYDSVYNCIFLSGALNGIFTIGDLFKGDIAFSGEGLANFLKTTVRQSNAMVKFFVGLLANEKLLTPICEWVNGLVDEYKDRVFGKGMRNSFGLSMGLWSMCPEEDFDECVEFMFGSCKEEYPVIMDELAEIRKLLFATEDIVDGCIERGIPIAFLSNYNLSMAPVNARCNSQGDKVIEVYGTSFHATAANYGETLSDEALAGVAEEFISPDRIINASTCRYPSCTWFIKDARHVASSYGTDYAEFVSWLVMSDTQRTVYDNASYPRFMLSDTEETLRPATAQ